MALSHPSSKTQKEKTYDKGVRAEKYAALYLQAKGYKILEARYKTKYGEIDIIAKRGNMIVFVEVKARQNIEQALESITPKMKKRIADSAQYYLSENEAANFCDLRFDVIAMKSPFSSLKFIEHVDNAWQLES